MRNSEAEPKARRVTEARRGRSILDVLCTLVVAGCVSAVAAPNLKLTRLRSSSAAREVAKAMGLAQAKARTLGSPFGLKLLCAPDRWIVWHDRDGDRRVAVEEIVAGPTRLPPGARFARPSGEDPITLVDDKVLFRSSGAVGGISGSVWIMVGDATSRVTVLSNGRIHVYDRAAGGAD